MRTRNKVLLLFVAVLFLGSWAGSKLLIPRLMPGLDCVKLFNEERYAEALPVCETRAKAGDSFSRKILGDMYFLGRGVKRDYEKAYPLLLPDAEEGLPPYQYAVGTMLLSHSFSGRNLVEAENWLSKAAKACHPIAAMLLAGGYQKEDIFGVNLAEAYKWSKLVMEEEFLPAAEELQSKIAVRLNEVEKSQAAEAATVIRKSCKYYRPGQP